MKIVAFTLLAFIAAVFAGPISVSDNNIGDIVTVGINANLNLSNQVDQDIVNVIIALLNQQAIAVAPSAETNDAAPASVETPKLPEISHEMVEKFKALLN